MTSTSTPAFPPFLEAVFSEDALDASDTTYVVIEADGRILWVNEAWTRFAERNGGDGLTGSTSYFDGIGGPLRDFYAGVFAEALATSVPYEQDYECSSPVELRRFHMRALPIDGRALVLEHSLTVAVPHEPATAVLPIARYLGPTGFMTQCANCRRVRRPATTDWDWVPELVERIHPATSHGICSSCMGFYFRLHWRED